MDLLKNYIETSAKIIGRRSPGKKAYDQEVLRWLHITKDMRSALNKANERFPAQALSVSDDELPDVQAQYEYIRGHEQIMRRLRK